MNPKLKEGIKIYWSLFLIAGVIVALDQWTKELVRTHIPFAASWLPASMEWLSPYARIVNWHNTGAAFGIFQNGAPVFAVLAIIVIGVIIYYYRFITDGQDWLFRLAMGMQLGGAAGNLIDRLLFNGHVTDFLSVGSFPVFNIADSSITIGTILLLFGVWSAERREKNLETKTTPETSTVSVED